MKVIDINDIKDKLDCFKDYECIVIICRYNGGKSSVITNQIINYFGEINTRYVTFIDQSKPNFIPRKSQLKLGQVIKKKVIIFDEIDDEEKREVKPYLKSLIENNLVIILSNLYGSSNDSEKEVNLFKKYESDILPQNTLFMFVKR